MDTEPTNTAQQQLQQPQQQRAEPAVLRSEANRHAPELFMHSKEAQWSAYQTARSGHAHTHTRQEKEAAEARANEPALTAELEALLAKVNGAAASPTAGTASVHGQLEGEMQRAAAMALHASLIELLAAAEPMEEDAHIWATEGASSTILSVVARFPGSGSDAWGELTIEPPLLKFTPGMDLDACGGCDSGEWPLHSFAGVNDDQEEHERCELRLLQGEDDGLLFGFEHAIDLAKFERMLRATVLSARAAACASSASSSATSPVAQRHPGRSEASHRVSLRVHQEVVSR